MWAKSASFALTSRRASSDASSVAESCHRAMSSVLPRVSGLRFSSVPTRLAVMKRAHILFIAAAAGAGALSVPRDAHALGPVDLEIGARIGGASSPVSGGLNPLGFGLGARAGVSLFSFYGGLSFMYYFGGGQDVGTGGAAPPLHPPSTPTLFGVALPRPIRYPPYTLSPPLSTGNYTSYRSRSRP